MGIKTYLILMTITTVVAWSGWFVVITNVDPQFAGVIGFTFFYLSLFLSLLGTFSLFGFLFRSIFYRRRRATINKVSTAFRQALLWSLAVILALALQSQKLLVWWMILLMVFLFSMVEMTFIISNKSREN